MTWSGTPITSRWTIRRGRAAGDDVDDTGEEGLIAVTGDDDAANSDSVRRFGLVEESPHEAGRVDLVNIGGEHDRWPSACPQVVRIHVLRPEDADQRTNIGFIVRREHDAHMGAVKVGSTGNPLSTSAATGAAA